ncbi:MAG: SRPBCC domain-containing protein [Fimbriimonadaceae bacterium]|nr:SRPBCC domain-containing protein [Fimbriimonadaceae bacterium]
MTTRDITRVTQSLTVDASGERVFTALTDAGQLRTWFCPNMEVDPRQGGAFHFWGDTVYMCPTREEVNQRITRFEPSHTLAFSYDFRGITSEVIVTVQHLQHGAEIKMSFNLRDNASEETFYVANDMLYCWLHNLRTFLDSGQPVLMPSHRQAGGTMRLTIHIDGPADDVFRALTDPKVMDTWISKTAEVELKEGGVYSYGWSDIFEGVDTPNGPTKILRFEPGRLLEHDWFYMEETPTHVRWEIQGSGGSCTLKITHSGFVEDQKLMSNYVNGWSGFLCVLKSLIEGKPMTKKHPDQ